MKKSIQMLCFAVLLFAYAGFAAGQIRMPKIFKPQTDRTPTPDAQNPHPQNPAPFGNSRQPADQSPADSLAGATYIDDGFTWFESTATEVLSEKQTGVPTGWSLKSSARLLGVYPKRSAFKFVVSKNGTPVGTTRCEATTYNIPADNPADVSFIFTDGCFDKTAATKDVGKFEVEVLAINGTTNAETSVRKYKIEVFKVERVNGQIGKFAAPDKPRYVISRYAESPVSILFLRPAHAYGYVFSGERTTINQVEIHYSVSPFADINSLHATLRCSVDGKLLQFPGEGYSVDLAVSNAERRYEEIYSDRLAPKYQTGEFYKDNFGFELVRVTLPLTYGAAQADQTRLNLKDHPGNWECSMRTNGETLRTWRWLVGRDGMPVKHAEQNGNINLYFNSYLIETEIPAGSSLDKRLAPTSQTDGFFYGQKWTTAEGRAMAGKIPVKGNPTPLPSNKIK